jgi:cytochrome c oxidase subunit I+III
MWDAEDREEDARRVERGDMVLDTGHETPASTVLDARWDETLHMPSDSPWPILLAAAAAVVFTMLLLGHVVTAAVFTGLGALILGAWHWQEPAAA